MTPDQKKYLLIGGGVGAVAIVGVWLFSSRTAFSGPSLPESRRPPEGHDHHEKRHRGRGDPHEENQRGEYGRKKKKKHRHKRHGHGG